MIVKKEKWQIELEAGNIWRAKEILRSNIRYIYDTDVYLAYGKILYDFKDYYEAGKYLFIAGEDIDGIYSEAIHIFLARYKDAYFTQLMSNLPRKFVQESFDNYPKNVQDYIQNRGYTKKDYQKYKKDNQYIEKPFSLFSKIIGMTLLVFSILSLIVGGATIIEYLLG